MISQRVLFLCTGNYYRSRFAEELFNAVAAERGLGWRADSMALAERLEALVENVGPMSFYVLHALRELGYEPANHDRYPRAAQPQLFGKFARIIAVYELEHRPMIEARFGEAASRVEYWDVPDIDELDPERALQSLARNVQALVEQCAGGAPALPRSGLG